MSSTKSDFLTFIEKHVIPRLEDNVDFDDVVETAESVIELITNLAHERIVYTKKILHDSFRLIKAKIQDLADWIIRAFRKGLSSLKEYLQANPHLLNGLKEPVGVLVTKLTLFVVGKISVRHAIEMGTVLAVERANEAVVHAVVTTATNPAGIMADVVQVLFEVAGMSTPGKLVGASGNIFGGAVAGSIVGGPVGALVGAGVSGGLWGLGELVRHAIGQIK